ncbi:MAG TPA: Gfo/Idh/MocA family oxidoreductase [Candidatus Acidoferrum sp.]|nr:Gfo/Idh/MocA family oxidoreductase [Candidatus Acidoferrum sp.]
MLSRRTFSKRTAYFTFGLAAAPLVRRVRAAASPGNKILVGVLGLGRGGDHVRALQQIENVEVAYICDVDDNRAANAAKLFAKAPRQPKTAKDFRRILDDKTIDAITIATPNHWHAPAAILACAAGKHVYVEKPGSHNAREGELLVEAARKHNRVVQMGNQRRSWPGVIEAVEKLRAGAIGKVFSARCWYNNTRASIGRGQPVPVPATLDYSMWQGPAPERPYVSNLIPYNWHWRWHWGGGELANNGIHALDVARWGLGAEVPSRVTCNGGRYHFDDDQETPDTTFASYHFGDRAILWDNSSCNPRGSDKLPFVEWYGENGTLAQIGNGYKIYDPKGKVLGEGTGPAGDKSHFENFLNAIRGEAKLTSEIAVGQTSTLLCHLGNIAYRTGHTIHVDPQSRKIVNDKDAEKLWGREYRKGWEPRV